MFGTTTLVIDDGDTAIFIDDFFSSPRFARVAFGTLSPHEVAIDEALGKKQSLA
jgi:hypothetical protein